MFGKNAARDSRRQAEEQARRAREQQAQATQYMQTAAPPDPVEAFINAENLGFLEDSTGKSGPVDVTRMRGMAPHYGLYNAAINRQNADKQGTGLMRMGQAGSNPNLAALISQNRGDRQRQEAGGQLENAFAMKNAEVRGSIMPLLGLGQNRRMGLAGMASGNANAMQGFANQSRGLASQLAMSSGFFNSNLFNQMMGGAQRAATGFGG